jgi:predicted RND superfamily exporter protein
MKAFPRFVVRNRFFVLAAICLITFFLGYQAFHIPRDTDLFSLFPAEDPDVVFFKKTGDKFGYNFINIVALETEDIFTHEALSVLRELTVSIEQIRGVKEVLSLANVPDMRRIGETIVIKPLIDPEGVPGDPEELSHLQKYVLANRMLVGNLVSADGKAALISVRIDEDSKNKEVAGQIKAAVAEVAPGSRVYFAGLSMVTEYMERLITGDMARLMPLIVALFFLMLYLSFLNLRGLFLTIGTVVLAIVWALGAMSVLGMALSMVTFAVPMVIMIIATISSVFVIVHYVQCEGKRDSPEITERVLAEVAVPVLSAHCAP